MNIGLSNSRLNNNKLKRFSSMPSIYHTGISV
jgi:hypothetical protein